MSASTSNVIDKFREFWNGLDSDEKSELYDLLTLTRGCDAPMELKKRFTGKIRFILFGQSTEKNDVAMTNSEPPTISDLETTNDLRWKNQSEDGRIIYNRHYLRHAVKAFERLQELGLIKQ